VAFHETRRTTGGCAIPASSFHSTPTWILGDHDTAVAIHLIGAASWPSSGKRCSSCSSSSGPALIEEVVRSLRWRRWPVMAWHTTPPCSFPLAELRLLRCCEMSSGFQLWCDGVFGRAHTGSNSVKACMVASRTSCRRSGVRSGYGLPASANAVRMGIVDAGGLVWSFAVLASRRFLRKPAQRRVLSPGGCAGALAGYWLMSAPLAPEERRHAAVCSDNRLLLLLACLRRLHTRCRGKYGVDVLVVVAKSSSQSHEARAPSPTPNTPDLQELFTIGQYYDQKYVELHRDDYQNNLQPLLRWYNGVVACISPPEERRLAKTK